MFAIQSASLEALFHGRIDMLSFRVFTAKLMGVRIFRHHANMSVK